jgi:hypothetical protein
MTTARTPSERAARLGRVFLTLVGIAYALWEIRLLWDLLRAQWRKK